MSDDKIIKACDISTRLIKVIMWVCITWMILSMKITYTNDGIDQIIIKGALVKDDNEN